MAVRMKRAGLSAGGAAGRGFPLARRAASGFGHAAVSRNGAFPSARRRQTPGKVAHFGLLLTVLVIVYLVSAFVSDDWVKLIQLGLFLAVTLLAVRTSRSARRTVRLAVAVVLCGTAIALALALADPAGPGGGVAYLWMALMLLFAVILIVARVLVAREVTLQSIYGAISAYMIIGLMFAAIFTAISKFDGGAFFADGQPGNAKTFQYFSFVTLTTVGYGDFTAAGSGGRAVAVLEALLGQIFLATLVARLVAAYRGPRQPGTEPNRLSRAGSRQVLSATNRSAPGAPYRRRPAGPRSPPKDAAPAPGTSRASNAAGGGRHDGP
jgi:Ion channel